MSRYSRAFGVIALALIGSLLLAACGAAAVQVPTAASPTPPLLQQPQVITPEPTQPAAQAPEATEAPQATEASQPEAQMQTPEATEASQPEAQVGTPEPTEASQPEAQVQTPEATEASQPEAQVGTPEPTEASQPEAQTETPEAPSTGGQGEFEVKTHDNETLGKILVDNNKMTLYTYKNDRPGVSNCTGACAQQWPPVIVPQGATIKGDSDIQGALGTIRRADGSSQLTYNGMPLYRYSGDTQEDQANGQGIGGLWYVVTVGG